MTTPPFDLAMLDLASGRRLDKECGPCDAGAELTIIPEFMYFGYVPPGATSDWQPLIIKNTGIVSVGIDVLEVTGQFEISNLDAVLLVPGEIATYSVRFAPTVSGLLGGDINITAATAGPQPVVKLIGIGGELATNTIGGGSGGGVAWAYRYGAFAVQDIATDEILMDYHVTTAHRLQSNLAGCKVSVGTGPATAFPLKLLKNGVQVATLTVNPNKTTTLATVGGASVQVPINSIMTVQAPTIPDVVIKRLRMTFVGVV